MFIKAGSIGPALPDRKGLRAETVKRLWTPAQKAAAESAARSGYQCAAGIGT